MDFFLHLTPQEFFTGLLTICVVNLVLSGDNAVVIAMASRNLPPKQRKKAIIWGSVFAIALRVVLTVVAAILLNIPYIRTIGAALLIFIGIKLLTDDNSGEGIKGSGNMMAAIRTIVVADLIMSLDNVLAVAAASKGHLILLILGLAISVPIIIAGSQLLVWVMNKLPFFVYIGAGLIAYTAGDMINGDSKVAPPLYNFLNIPESMNWILPVFLIVVVCGVGLIVTRRKKKKAEA